jgi:hypothetical protein
MADAVSMTNGPSAGAVQLLSDSRSRACLQRRATDGRMEHICGPRRGEKRKAEEDLEAIRAAAAGSREAWGAMAAQAHRLQERANFEARVAAYVGSYASAPEPSLPPPAVESPSLEDTQPYDSQDYDNDVNELWQEIDDEGNLPSSYQHPPLIPVADPKDSLEATALLSQFRPARMSTEDLKKLLDARADPNITLSGDIHPLLKVMTFADAGCVGPMRDLLLEAGAIESEAAKEHWRIRRHADACEEDWMRKFHHDPR